MRMSTNQVTPGFGTLLILLAASAIFSAWAQQPSGQTPDIYKRIWGAAQLYDDTDNTVGKS